MCEVKHMNRNLMTRFRHIAAPNALLDLIDSETNQLQARYSNIREFTVLIEKLQSKHQKSNQVCAHISIRLPGKRIEVTREADGMMEKDNALMALRLAFSSANSMIEQHLNQLTDMKDCSYSLSKDDYFIPHSTSSDFG